MPLPPVSVETWAEALADAVGLGLARAVGVSNYSADQMRRTHAVLARRGVPLASNQVEFSLLQRRPERDGLLRTCQELGVQLIAYSPLAKGLLGGRYTRRRPPSLARRLSLPRGAWRRLPPLLALVREIGLEQGGKTPAQVALNWLLCKGALPIPGARNASQVEENAGALGWRLTDAQVAALDRATGG
jgi:aryl-alcohol dehydrogenase-like predicted oxidoreductase